ncbi:MAG: TetR/AcrR family transcriptional regulator [Solirubrobacteraceae bacterium]
MARPRAEIDPAKLVGAFAARGLEGTSSDELATLAGVAKPTLYAHGHTKETLFLLATEIEVERLLERVSRAERLTRGRTARDCATGIAHAILGHGAARPDGLRLIARIAHSPGADPGNHPVISACAATVARIPNRISTTLRRDLTTDGLDASLAPMLAILIWGAAARSRSTPAASAGPIVNASPRRSPPASRHANRDRRRSGPPQTDAVRTEPTMYRIRAQIHEPRSR